MTEKEMQLFTLNKQEESMKASFLDFIFNVVSTIGIVTEKRRGSNEEIRQRESSRYLSDARRTRRRRWGRQVSSLKLKDAQNWNSPAKVGRCASRGCFEDEVDCFQPPYLSARSSLLFHRTISPSNKFCGYVYAFIRKLRIAGAVEGRSIGCRKSDDRRADSTFRTCLPTNFAPIVAKMITRDYHGNVGDELPFNSAGENIRIYSNALLSR